MEYIELEKKVLRWAKNKKILSEGNPLAQSRKTMEEALELHEALSIASTGVDCYYNEKGEQIDIHEEIIDAIGDTFVTLIIQAEMQDLDLLECLESAYNVISKRTGKMVSGTFVKDK